MAKMPKDEKLKDLFLECDKECKDQLIEIRAAQDKSLGQYLCKKDFSKKKSWQSKVYTPIGKPAIKKATRMIKRSLIDVENYIDFITPTDNPMKKRQCNLTKRIVKSHLDSDKFLDKFSEATESGFTLCLMILKFWVGNVPRHWTVDPATSDLVTKTLPHLKIKAVNPFNLRFTTDKSIFIEDEWIKLPDLMRLSDANGGPFRKGIINKMAQEDYTKEGRTEEDSDRLKEIGIGDSANKYRKDCLISHYWGPLLDDKGNTIMKNCHFVVGNHKYILLKPEENPFWHGKPPYVVGSPLPVLFRHVGKSLIEDVAGLEDAIVSFINLQIDNLKWITLGINEVDEMALSDVGKTELTELYPGRMVRKRSGYDKPAFAHHEIGTPPEKSMPLLHELQIQHDRDTLVTEYTTALPSSGANTLGEYQGKQTSGAQDFASIARDIERSFLVECADMARDLIVQYLSDFNRYPEITAIFQNEGHALDNMSYNQKRAMIVTDLDIVGRGISIFFDRHDRLNKLGTYVKMLNAMPEQAQLYPEWVEILDRMNEAFAFDRRETLVKTEEGVQKIMASRQQAQQQQMQQAVMMKVQEWQHEAQEWLMEFKAKMAKLQQESIENAKDREQELLLAVLDHIEKQRAENDATNRAGKGTK